ncbi:hypothetical protein [Natronosalvus rutilus]|uniref:Uncharacterized protein n=1 Tax=Natronosalvus rutilus TaxID=2953753 RepID=A0A9E7NBV4_9EURY|nr:hypothetical protein [Natronosalvus rutilus]UTF55589.1 hypothetical protein NGM29_19490 [Natronosalvus rutilus]
MAKATVERLLEEIADSFHTYLRKGVRFDRVIGSAHKELDIDDIETLLRIHFVLTDAEGGGNDVGVVDFMRKLEARIRRMKTSTSPQSSEHHGEVRGQLNWSETVKRRARVGRLDEPIFVCDRPKVHYDIDENLVLKRLLSVVYDTVTEDLAYARNNPNGYEWLEAWVQSDFSPTGRKQESTADMFDRIYQKNIYLQRIKVDETEISKRTIESVKRSRSKFYREAAILLDRYRQLMSHELDSVEARDILDHTLIAPDKAEILFELYWVFRVLDAYEGVEYRVLTDNQNDTSTIATWEHRDSRFALYHDATGENLTFEESIDAENVKPDGYLYRMNEVLCRRKSLSSDMLDHGGRDVLWGGRPDIVLEQYKEKSDGEQELAQVFIGEVKYTQSIDYVATGLRELLEYMAFVKHQSTSEYVERAENVLDSVNVKGVLFVDELDQETVSPPNEEIKIVQYPDSPGRIL